MKLFSVLLQVRIVELGPLEEPKPSATEALGVDSPWKDMGKLVEVLKDQGVFPSTPIYPGYGDAMGSMSMSESVKIAASSFEELQAILAKFHATATSLSDFSTEENKK